MEPRRRNPLRRYPTKLHQRVAFRTHPSQDKSVEQPCIKAVNLDPGNSLAHSAIGLAFMEDGEYDNSIAAHTTATMLNPNSAFGHWCFGYVLNRADRYEEALRRFDLALRLSPRDPAAWSYFTTRGVALYHLGDYAAALAAARDATRTLRWSILSGLLYVWRHR